MPDHSPTPTSPPTAPRPGPATTRGPVRPAGTARRPVPVAIWPVEPDARTHTQAASSAPGRGPSDPEPAGLLTPGLASQILTEYTQPGQLALDPVALSPVVLLAAARAGRRSVALPAAPGGATRLREALTAGLEPSQRALTAVRERAAVFPGPLTDLTGQVDAIILDASYPAIAQLKNTRSRTYTTTATTAPAGTLVADPDLGGLLGAVQLAGHAAVLGALSAQCAQLLRPGGLLIAVTTNPHRHGRLIDLAALTVRLATGAGLSYLQHVIALTVPITGGALTPPSLQEPPPGPAGPTGPAGPSGPSGSRPEVHRRVHADITVFRNPPRPAAGEREAGRD